MGIKNAMKIFFVQVWSTYKGLFHWLNWPAYLSNVFLRPAIQIILWSILGRFAVGSEKAQVLVLGLAVMQMNEIVIGGITQSYTNDTEYRTISFFYVSPANRLENFMSRSVLHYPNALLSFGSSMIAAWLIMGANFGMVNWAGFITVILITAGSITAFAQLMGTYALALKEWIPVLGISGGIISVLTGAIIPISIFPDAIQQLARLLPITNGLVAVRATFSGTPLSEVYGYALREALTGITYLIIAAIAFLYIERWAKRTGSFGVEI